MQLYALPYSEHSSFAELKLFVQSLVPLAATGGLQIVPTVNLSTRNEQEQWFAEWIREVSARTNSRDGMEASCAKKNASYLTLFT